MTKPGECVSTRRRNLNREMRAFSKTHQISGFNLVTKHSENISRHASRSGLEEARRRGDQGDSSLVNRLSLRGLPLQSLHFSYTMRFSTLLTLTSFTGLTALLLLPTASAQTLAPIHKAPFNEPLEKYNMPPAPPRKIETSPRKVSQFGVFTSFQANVDANGNNILGDAANEPSIAVDPTDGNKMMIAWRQFNSITSDFRQAGWGYTTDAGVTWTFPGVLQNNVFRSDPVTKSDETGNFFYLSLQSTQPESFFCDDLWRSTNGGQSWTEQSPDEAGHGGDKEWFTIDTNVGGMGHGFVYQFWTGVLRL